MSQVIADISQSAFKVTETIKKTYLNKWYKELYR